MNFPIFFFLVDVIPEYMQKTFGVDVSGRFPSGSVYRGVREGEDIPKNLMSAVIVYHASDYHGNLAINLQSQIYSLHPGAVVVLLPVRG